jgi:tryptophan-rich sensory protein
MNNYILYLIYVIIAAGLASYYTFQGLKSSKYINSIKPSWFPPPVLFGIVWTILYLMYSYSWYKAPDNLNWLFILNMILNVLWCFLFFGIGEWGYALGVLILLDIVLFIQVIYTYKYDELASTILIPYLLWSCFASFLNYTMIQIN